MKLEPNPVPIEIDLSVGASRYKNANAIDSSFLRDENIRRSVIERLSADFEENLERLLVAASSESPSPDCDTHGHEPEKETEDE